MFIMKYLLLIHSGASTWTQTCIYLILTSVLLLLYLSYLKTQKYKTILVKKCSFQTFSMYHHFYLYFTAVIFWHYRVRVKAVNSVGAGPPSPSLRANTLPLPPSPPHLSCPNAGHNYLKLKWGDGKNPQFTQYTVQMENPRLAE